MAKKPPKTPPGPKRYRAIEEINQEYNNECAKLGDAQYKLAVQNSNISKLISRINALVIEGNALPKEDNGQSPKA